MESIANGDAEAFRELIQRYRPLVFAAILKMVRSAQEAEDIAQEAFIQMYRSFPQFRNRQGIGLKSWMMRIAANKAIDWLRKNRAEYARWQEQTKQFIAESRMEKESHLEKEIVRQEQQQELYAQLSQLPERYRKIVELHYFQDKSYREIALSEGIALKTVEARLYRAKQMLRNAGKEEER